MAIVRTRVTAQGRAVVPAAIRRKLGVGPGSLLEWDVNGDQVTVRRAGRFTSVDIHEAVFGRNPPAKRTVEEMKRGITRHVRDRHVRC